MKVATIPGDGTGPEVTAEAIKVLDAVSKIEGFAYETQEFDFGGERYLKTGDILPEGAVDELQACDAIFLGAVGHPDVQPAVFGFTEDWESIPFPQQQTSVCLADRRSQQDTVSRRTTRQSWYVFAKA